MSLVPTGPGGNATGLPGAPPFGALSRRVAMLGALTVAGLKASGRLPALGRAAPSSANGARLADIAAKLRALHDRIAVLSTAYRSVENCPGWDGLIARFEPLEDAMAELPADTLAGALAKARALQIPTCRDCARPELGNSLADDLVRLHTMGALS